MIPAEEPVEDGLVDALQAMDEAIRAGASVPATDGDLHEPLGKVEECMRLLNRAWPSKKPGSMRRVGRFLIERELGRGSYGIVYLARDPSLQRRVAVKIPRLEVVLSAELLERFQREAQTAAALDHPHVVPVFEAGRTEDHCYIASAYCEGTTLAVWLKQQSAPVEFHAAARLIRDLTLGVAHAHERGVVHRDLKPSNVLLTTEGESLLPRITDFGMARFMTESSELTQSRTMIGTPAYMSPEQARGQITTIGPSSDVYSLGAMLYELLVGQPPFQAATLLETLDQVRSVEPVPLTRVRSNIPADLETICMKCLRKEPTQRYQSATDLAEDLGRFLDGKLIKARRLSTLEHFVWWCGKRERVRDAAIGTIAFGGIMLLYAVSTSVYLLSNISNLPDPPTVVFFIAFYLSLYSTILLLGLRTLRRRSTAPMWVAALIELVYPICIYLLEDTIARAFGYTQDLQDNHFVYAWARYFFSTLALVAATFNLIGIYSTCQRQRTRGRLDN